MSKLQWTMLTLSGIIFVLSVNVWAAKRDAKLLQIYTNSPTYSLQWTDKQLLLISTNKCKNSLTFKINNMDL